MGSIPKRRSRRVLAASAMLGMVGGSLATMGTAHAAVTISGSTVDAAGNYVDGYLTIYKFTDKDGDGTVEPFEYDRLPQVEIVGGAFDVALEDGAYKLQYQDFSSDNAYADEYYRDKATLDTADFVTVAGAAQVLPAWTIEQSPAVTGIVTGPDGRPARGVQVTAYTADDRSIVSSTSTDGTGAFRVGTSETVKLFFSGGRDAVSGKYYVSEWFNDKGDFASADLAGPGANVGAVALSFGGTIAGRITNDAGAPLVRARACAQAVDYSQVCDDTDANGVYLIEGVRTGPQQVKFTDPIGEYATEYYNNVAAGPDGLPVSAPTLVNVGPGQAVAGIDAGLAPSGKPAPEGVDLSGVVRDEVGGVGVGYTLKAWTVTADPRDAEVVAQTISNRAGAYAFTTLDRVAGNAQFKIEVVGEQGREDGEFARRTIWSGQKLELGTATPVTAAPQALDFVQPVAGGVAGAVTSEAGGLPESPAVLFQNADASFETISYEFQADGSYETRNLWAGDYKVRFSGYQHVAQWWKGAVASDAKTITVKPGQVVTGISASLSKEVKAVERPEVVGNAWVGKTIRADKGEWNVMSDNQFTYEWLVKGSVVGTGPSFKVAKKYLGDKITARVTNDAGFAQGQAVTKSTAKVGYKPKLKTKATAKRIAMTLKVKPLKAKKVKATVVVYEVKGKKANGELKLKKLAKAKITKGTGTAVLKKALSKGKHKLVYRIKGKGKVGSGDLTAKVKIKR